MIRAFIAVMNEYNAPKHFFCGCKVQASFSNFTVNAIVLLVLFRGFASVYDYIPAPATDRKLVAKVVEDSADVTMEANGQA